jgi:hypothetical protein
VWCELRSDTEGVRAAGGCTAPSRFHTVAPQLNTGRRPPDPPLGAPRPPQDRGNNVPTTVSDIEGNVDAHNCHPLAHVVVASE